MRSKEESVGIKTRKHMQRDDDRLSSYRRRRRCQTVRRRRRPRLASPAIGRRIDPPHDLQPNIRNFDHKQIVKELNNRSRQCRSIVFYVALFELRARLDGDERRLRRHQRVPNTEH